MASKRDFSETVGTIDIKAMMEAFEAINDVRITFTMELDRSTTRTDLLIGARAEERDHEGMAAKILASVSARCSVINLRSMDAAVIHVLYLLDGQLAYQEMQSAEVKKA